MLKKLVIIFLSLASMIFAGCVLKPYTAEIDQGNVIEKEEVARVHIGMSKEEVLSVLGTSILHNAFDDNHWIYAYTNQVSGEKITVKRIELKFTKQGRLTDIKSTN